MHLSTQNLDLTTPAWSQVSSYGLVTWDTTNLTPYIIGGYIISRASNYVYAIVPASAYFYSDPNTDGQAHTYQVRAFTGTTTAWVSAPSPATTEPPVNVRRAGQGQIRWDPVAGHNGPGDGYHVYLNNAVYPITSVDASGHYPRTPVCWSATRPSDTALLAPGTAYHLSVATFNKSVNAGKDEANGATRSATSSSLPPPTCACGTSATAFADHLNPVATGATYNIYANGDLIAKGLTTDYYGYSYEFTSPLHETYTVTAVDAQGHESAASPPVSNPIWDSSAC